jgi:hypothetical protein
MMKVGRNSNLTDTRNKYIHQILAKLMSMMTKPQAKYKGICAKLFPNHFVGLCPVGCII